MWIIELLVVLLFIFLGARLGSIGIGFAGGLGVLVLALGFGLKPGDIPIDVILIIMSVIAAIAAMQVAGGLDYLVQLAERILRSNPKYITFLAPLVTYSLGQAFEQMENIDNALHYYQLLSQMEGFAGEGYLGLGRAYEEKNQLDKAGEAYEKYLALVSEDPAINGTGKTRIMVEDKLATLKIVSAAGKTK